MNYMDNPNMSSSKSGPYQASNLNPGFEVYIEKRHKAYWVKDITKSLLIKPFNPRTGRPIFEPYFG
jgi:viroplasmin and RNaseH domain-containing protein